MLCCWSHASRLVIFNKHFLKVIPRVNDIRLETCELVHYGGLKHNWQVIGHYVSVATVGSHGDGITHQPLLGIGMAIVSLDPIDLEVCGPLYNVEPSHEGLWAITNYGSVING